MKRLHSSIGYKSPVDSLRDQNAIMDKNVMNPEARKILGEIKSETDELQSIGESLFNAYDYEMNATGTFEFKNDEELIRRLDDVAAGIRSNGLELAKIELISQPVSKVLPDNGLQFDFYIIIRHPIHKLIHIHSYRIPFYFNRIGF